MNAFLFLYSGSFLGHIFLMRENRRIRFWGETLKSNIQEEYVYMHLIIYFYSPHGKQGSQRVRYRIVFIPLEVGCSLDFLPSVLLFLKAKIVSLESPFTWLLKSRDDTSIFPLQVSFCAMAFYSQLQLTQLLPYNPIIAILFIFSGIQLVFLFFSSKKRNRHMKKFYLKIL